MLHSLTNFCFISKERSKILKFLQDAEMDRLFKTLKECTREHKNVVENLKNVTDDGALQILKKAEVVGMTTSKVAAHQKLIATLSPKVMFYHA